ncbi:MAG TPA: pilus assembly protein TadG-related protein [Actinomycetota bacterium]|nr:pilus assembly protein TadG-related protein [Actinomycetota bacterium]
MSERGQVTVFVAGMTLVVLAVVGVAVDATRAFLFRRTLQNAADASALAGASEIDRALYYGADRVELAEGSAVRAARDWLATRAVGADAAISIEGDEVEVVLRGSIPSTFLGVVGIGELTVAAEARAAPIAGAP